MDEDPIVAPVTGMQQGAIPVDPVTTDVQQNTSPMFPPRIQEPEIATPVAPALEETQPTGGAMTGIEAEGVQR